MRRKFCLTDGRGPSNGRSLPGCVSPDSAPLPPQHSKPMNYLPKADHRRPAARQKSQWTISDSEERDCFELAATSDWTWRNSYWGLHVSAGTAQFLGSSQAPEREPVFIAKFIEDQANWHGYPVAHWRSPYDKPSSGILKDWHAKGYIRKKTVKRVVGGRRCTP
jgi:hypothetical protein